MTQPRRRNCPAVASLDHPGDSYSYDIYSQAGTAVRKQSRSKVLGGLTPKKVLAAGESQWGPRLITYIDAVQPHGPHVRRISHSQSTRRAGGRTAAGHTAPSDRWARPRAGPAPMNVPSPTAIRDDLDVPVLVFQTQTDVFNGNVTARQPDSENYRLWEVAGTSHYDTYGLSVGMTDTGDGQGAVQMLAAMQQPSAARDQGCHRMQPPDQYGTGALGTQRGALLAEPMGHQESRTADRTSATRPSRLHQSCTRSTPPETRGAASVHRRSTSRSQRSVAQRTRELLRSDNSASCSAPPCRSHRSKLLRSTRAMTTSSRNDGPARPCGQSRVRAGGGRQGP